MTEEYRYPPRMAWAVKIRELKTENKKLQDAVSLADGIIESARNGLNQWMDAFPLAVEECDYVMLNEMSDWQEKYGEKWE